MSDCTTDPGDELDIHKIESAVKLYYGYTGAYTRHLLKEWLAEELRQAKADGFDEGVRASGLDLDYTLQLLDNNPYRSQP